MESKFVPADQMPKTIALRVIVAAMLQLKRLQAAESLLAAEEKCSQTTNNVDTKEDPTPISFYQRVLTVFSGICSLMPRRAYESLNRSSRQKNPRLQKLEQLVNEWSTIFPFTNYDLVLVSVQHGTGASSSGFIAKTIRKDLIKSTFSLADHSAAFRFDPQCRVWFSRKGRVNVVQVLNLLLECNISDPTTK